MIRFVDGGRRSENYSGRIDLPQFGIRLARGSWTSRGDLANQPNFRGVDFENTDVCQLGAFRIGRSCPHQRDLAEFEIEVG